MKSHTKLNSELIREAIKAVIKEDGHHITHRIFL